MQSGGPFREQKRGRLVAAARKEKSGIEIPAVVSSRSHRRRHHKERPTLIKTQVS